VNNHAARLVEYLGFIETARAASVFIDHLCHERLVAKRVVDFPKRQTASGLLRDCESQRESYSLVVVAVTIRAPYWRPLAVYVSLKNLTRKGKVGIKNVETGKRPIFLKHDVFKVRF
tara:strand:+ start:216 stop:566 length:351 start_codon:yes stop_codon:yes gene_type:complete